jgi:hypothetical protein
MRYLLRYANMVSQQLFSLYSHVFSVSSEELEQCYFCYFIVAMLIFEVCLMI